MQQDSEVAQERPIPRIGCVSLDTPGHTVQFVDFSAQALDLSIACEARPDTKAFIIAG